MAPYFLHALLLSSCVSALALPSPKVNVKTHFNVKAQKKVATAPIAAIHKAYVRYGEDTAVLPPLSTKTFKTSKRASRVRQERAVSATVSATSQPGDSEYLANVKIGNQNMALDFDTGSADLWVFSTLQSSSSKGNHTLFNPNSSSTFKMIPGATWDITYGDGTVASGVVGTDTVSIGSATVQGQAVELAQNVQGQNLINDAASGGLVGLAMSKLNTVQPNQAKTFLDNVTPSLAQPVFTANLKAGSGVYGFGAIDSSAYSGSLAYAPIDNSGFWNFQPTSYAVGSQSIAANGVTAIADTGTSLILLTPALAQAFYAQVSGASQNNPNFSGVWTYPCSSTLPSFGFGVNGQMRTIAGSILTYAQVTGGSSSSPALCFGSIQQFNSNNIIVLGDSMFKAQYVVFNNSASGKSLGFAPHITAATTLTSQVSKTTTANSTAKSTTSATPTPSVAASKCKV